MIIMYKEVVKEIKKKQYIVAFVLVPLSIGLFLIGDYFFIPILYIISIVFVIAAIVLYLRFRKYLYFVLSKDRSTVTEIKLVNNYTFLEFNNNKALPLNVIIMDINHENEVLVQNKWGKTYMTTYTPTNLYERVEAYIENRELKLKLVETE